MKPFGLVIQPDGSVDTLKEGGLDNLQAAVGGYIEGVTLDGADGYVNEEGLMFGLPFNRLASQLVTQATGHGSPIVGPMVVIGPTDAAGNDTPVTDEWLDRLLPRVRSTEE